MCVRIPAACAVSSTAFNLSSGHTEPPPALAVCSTSSRVCGGALRRGSRNAARTVSGSNWPRSPLQSQHHRAGQRPWAAAFVGDDVRQFVRQDLVAGAAMGQDRDLVAHRAGRQKNRRFLAEQRGHPVAQLMDRGIVAVLLVADLGGHHRGLHSGRGLCLRVGIQVDPQRRQRGVDAGRGIEQRRGRWSRPWREGSVQALGAMAASVRRCGGP